MQKRRHFTGRYPPPLVYSNTAILPPTVSRLEVTSPAVLFVSAIRTVSLPVALLEGKYTFIPDAAVEFSGITWVGGGEMSCTNGQCVIKGEASDGE